jgi:hypothetical protein
MNTYKNQKEIPNEIEKLILTNTEDGDEGSSQF